MIEGYGMTEAAHQMASNPQRNRTARIVGVAAGPEMAIMDEAGRLLTRGEDGEIVIRGDNVTVATRTIRRPTRKPSSTAGFAPAIRARSTPTAF